MRLKILCVFSVMVWLAAGAADNAPLPFVSLMFGDNMVLQRGKPIRVWGWAKPGEAVRVELDGRMATATTDAHGRWQTEIKAPAPGGPYAVKISGAENTVTLHEVLVGDVWLCGGQSNMEMGIGQVRNEAEEIKTAGHPEIRLFTVKNQVAYSPAAVPQGSWKICSPQTVGADGWGGFSAVAYFFGRRLQEDIHAIQPPSPR